MQLTNVISNLRCALVVISLCVTFSSAVPTCPVIGKPGTYTYDDATTTGPTNWGTIPTFETCSSGQKQSPINFPASNGIALLPRPVSVFTTAPMELHAKTENWAFDCASPGQCGQTIRDTKIYNVLNLHFHAPSEHHINGKSYPLEAHIVHVGPNGELLVLATMFEISDSSASNAVVNEALDAVCSGSTTASIPLVSILGLTQGVLSYSGSLTTPPCSEGVTFFMQKKVQSVTSAQVAQYIQSIGSPTGTNNRPILPLNGRSITPYI